ncbi:tRNA (adenine(22)-N(1))-methyltransferase TrmK, partial [Streptococcus suis]
LTDHEQRFGPFLSQERSSVFVAKWQRELDKLVYALSCVPEARAAERASISQKIKAIEEVISHES